MERIVISHFCFLLINGESAIDFFLFSMFAFALLGMKKVSIIRRVRYDCMKCNVDFLIVHGRANNVQVM